MTELAMPEEGTISSSLPVSPSYLLNTLLIGFLFASFFPDYPNLELALLSIHRRLEHERK